MKRRTWGLWTLVTAGALVFGGGCVEGGTEGTPSVSSQIQGAITLTPVQSCGELDSYLKDTAKEYVELMFSQNSGGCWDCVDKGGVPVPVSDNSGIGTGGSAGGESGGPAAPSEPGGNDGAEPQFDSGNNSGGGAEEPTLGDGETGTNNQEKGVDEADIVKTDGAYLYMVRGGTLLIVDVWPAEESHVVANVILEGWPQQMFLQDETVAVFSQVSVWDESIQAKLGLSPENPGYWELGKVTLIDVSDRANPKLLREIYYEGNYVDARLVGTTARVVTRSPWSAIAGGYYYGVPSVGGAEPAVGGVTVDVDDAPSAGNGSTPSSGSAGSSGDSEEGSAGSAPGKADVAYYEESAPELTVEEYKAQLLKQIDEAKLEDFLPRMWNVSGDGKVVMSQLSACEHFYKPSIKTGLDFLSILTLDMANPTESRPTTTIIGDAGEVYGSASSLYIASNLFYGWYSMYADAVEDWQVTAIHQFDIATNGDMALYVASGKVPGSVLNQFALSEYKGNLRVATTKENWSNSEEQQSYVTILAPENGTLNQIGQVSGLGKGERIYAARFLGDKGFVVTFRQVDPLYTLDLSNPTQPKMVGELKIPGFSTYLHPMDDDHVLAIGQDTIDHGDWVETGGIQVAVFDVSDFANPKQAHKHVLTQGAYSEALYEHKAFNYHGDKGLLAIPLVDWNWGGTSGGALPPDAPSAEPQPTDDGDGGSSDGSSGSEAPSNDSGSGDPDDNAGAPAEEDWTDEPTDDTDPSDVMEEPYLPTIGLAVFSVDAVAGIAEKGFVDHGELLAETEYAYYGEEVRRSLILGDYLYSVGMRTMKVSHTDDLSEVAAVLFPEDIQYWGGKDIPFPDSGPADGAEGEGGGADSSDPSETPPEPNMP